MNSTRENNIIKLLSQPRIIFIFFFGLSSGLPIKLTSETLQLWCLDRGVSLEAVGLFSLVGLPYVFKFLWAPLFDCFSVPFLGRRRGWILVTHVALLVFIFLLSLIGITQSLWLTAIIVFLISFFSASQDIVLDAHRRDSLEDLELGFGNSLFVIGYRVALVISGACSIKLATILSWNEVYLLNTALVLVCIYFTFKAPEPKCETVNLSFKVALLVPIVELYSRLNKLGNLFYLIVFIIFYKVGDTLAATLTTPFLQALGYTKTEIALYGESFGLASLLFGTFLGGVILTHTKLVKFLNICCWVQAISTLAFVLLCYCGHNLLVFTLVEFFEKFTYGMGTIAFMAFLMKLTNRSYSASQYSFLTCIIFFLPRLLGVYSGYFVTATSWQCFYIVCTLIALPSLILVNKIKEWC